MTEGLDKHIVIATAGEGARREKVVFSAPGNTRFGSGPYGGESEYPSLGFPYFLSTNCNYFVDSILKNPAPRKPLAINFQEIDPTSIGHFCAAPIEIVADEKIKADDIKAYNYAKKFGLY